MKKITEQTRQTYPARVIQFGEGNFMRGFFNWQLQQMNKKVFLTAVPLWYSRSITA